MLHVIHLLFCLFTGEKRAIFDQFGEEGLKRGGGGGGGSPNSSPSGFSSGYTFHGDPKEMFSHLFGGQDPFAAFSSSGGGFGPGTHTRMSFCPGGGMSGMSFGGGSGGAFEDMDWQQPLGSFSNSPPSKRRNQDAPFEHTVNVALEELFHGSTKKMKISRNVIAPDGTTSKQDKVVSIDVKPGWKAGTKITFPKEGDQAIGRIPSDIVFVLKEKPHSHFKRDGNDLRHKSRITLKEALCGGSVKIPLINGGSSELPLNEVINPNTVHVLPGQGMPVSKQPGRRGDLIVNFDIVFPQSLPQKNKRQIRNWLP